MASLRILLADDDEMARRVITALLAFHPEWEVCGEASDGREAAQKVARLKPDIVLLDIDMPNLNGLEASRQIVQRDPSQKIIILAVDNTEQVARDVFQAGALGFVSKQNATHDLAVAIGAVQRGHTSFGGRFAETILKGYLEREKGPGAASATAGERERETIRLLTQELTTTLRHEPTRPKLGQTTAKYLAIGLALLAGAGVWWYVLSGEPTQAPPAVEKLLVSFGLKSPPPRAYSGNPETRVWIDVHTALYYCPGAEAYGKTAKGRIVTQRDAQMDHFEPAAGKTCD